MTVKPIETLEFHYHMMMFLIIIYIPRSCVFTCNCLSLIIFSEFSWKLAKSRHGKTSSNKTHSNQRSDFQSTVVHQRVLSASGTIRKKTRREMVRYVRKISQCVDCMILVKQTHHQLSRLSSSYKPKKIPSVRNTDLTSNLLLAGFNNCLRLANVFSKVFCWFVLCFQFCFCFYFIVHNRQAPN